MKKFTESLGNQVKNIMGENYQIQCQEVIKNNDTKLNALTIVSKENNISPTIYVDDFYNGYKAGVMSMNEIAKKIVHIYESNKPAPSMNINIDGILSYPKIKDKLQFKLVNKDKNKELLADTPYIPWLDLAIVFFIEVFDSITGNGTIRVNNRLLHEWNVSVDTIYEQAMKNTPVIKRYSIRNIVDTLYEFIDDNPDFFKEGIPDLSEAKVPMYVLTNKNNVFGAATILYPDLLKDFSTAVGGGFFIIPSSVHECLLVPGNPTEAETVAEMVKEANDTQVDAEEILSYSVYYYELENDEVLMFNKENGYGR